MHCRSGDYGEYQQSAMYVPVTGLYYPQDVQVCTVIQIFMPPLLLGSARSITFSCPLFMRVCNGVCVCASVGNVVSVICNVWYALGDTCQTFVDI